VTHIAEDQPAGADPDARRRLAKRLEEMPNVGPDLADHLIRLGIAGQGDLVGRDPVELYESLCRIDGVRHDRVLLDVFTAVIAYAEGGPPTPWWEYTPARKTREAAARRDG
jgi:hypothetical protein